MNRRDLLKLFGVGATVVPIGAGLIEPAVARIIEAPKIELVEPAGVGGLQAAFQTFATTPPPMIDVTVFVRDHHNRRSYRIDCQAFLQSLKPSIIDVTSLLDRHRQFRSDLAEFSFVATGEPRVTDYRP